MKNKRFIKCCTCGNYAVTIARIGIGRYRIYCASCRGVKKIADIFGRMDDKACWRGVS